MTVLVNKTARKHHPFAGSVGGAGFDARSARNNTMTMRSLLSAAVKGGVGRFIFSSTAAVYGNPEQVPVPSTHRLGHCRPTAPRSR